MVVFIKLRKKRPINVGYLKRFPRFHSFFLSKNRKNERNTIMKAFLILEDGHVFEGKSIGSTDEIISEIVFQYFDDRLSGNSYRSIICQGSQYV